MFCFVSSALSKSDSLKFVNFRGFYFNTYYPYKVSGTYMDNDKYPEYYFYQFDSYGYKHQSPGIGFGYVINHREVFLKTDINYWFGSKELNHDVSFSATDKNSADPYQSFPTFGNLYPPVGSRFYKIKDHYSGKINFHYFDIGFAVTGNITRFLRIYSGWRINYMLKYKYDAKVNREASLYEIKKYNSQYDRVDSLIQVENLEYTGEEAASKSTQRFSNFIFYNLGLNANFRIKKQLFFVDVLIEPPVFVLSPNGAMATCYTFKLAYVFNYSTYFGSKKI